MILLNQGYGARRPSGTFAKLLQENMRKVYEESCLNSALQKSLHVQAAVSWELSQ